MKTSLPGPSLIILGSRPLYKAKTLEPEEKEHKRSYSEHAMDLILEYQLPRAKCDVIILCSLSARGWSCVCLGLPNSLK